MVTATAGLILPSRRDDGGGDVGSKLCHDSSTRRAVIGLIIGLMGLIARLDNGQNDVILRIQGMGTSTGSMPLCIPPDCTVNSA